MNKEITKYIQDKYENILSNHWHKRHQIKELIEADSGSELRKKSINDRISELQIIDQEMNCFEKHFDDIELITPDWYSDWIARIGDIRYDGEVY